jgi:hypothetical protein
MGAFNTVDVERLTPCPRCGDTGSISIQFAYGDVQQHRYSVGDQLMWGGNDVGSISSGTTRILGTPEYCRRCGLPVDGEYVLQIRDGRLADYEIATPEDVAQLG